MSSWVYIFSKFTPEALLFEALILFLLACLYTAFWVLRKRRYGSIEEQIPSGPVKAYLNELIANAEFVRRQLFGLLSSHDTQIGIQINGSGPQLGNLVSDKVVGELEIKLAEQLKTLGMVTAEKADLEKRLSEVKTSGSTSSASGDTASLENKLKELEGKLAEYSVIEDDLANLKRLQQENLQLKAQISGKAPADASAHAPAETAAASTPAPAAEATATAPISPESKEAGDTTIDPIEAATEAALAEAVTDVTPAEAAAETVPTQSIASETAQDQTPTPAATPAEADAQKSEKNGVAAAELQAAAEAAADPLSTPDGEVEAKTTQAAPAPAQPSDFDALATQVESSLQEAAPKTAAAKSEVTGPAEPDLASATPKESSEEADLVAEFEKMLKS